MRLSASQLHTGLCAGAPLLVAILLAGSITAIQRHSDEYRRTQLRLAQFYGCVYHIHSIEEESVLRRRFGPAALVTEQAQEAAAVRILHDLASLYPGNRSLKRMDEDFNAYASALHSEIPFLDHGDVKHAESIAYARVDPAYAELLIAFGISNRYFDIHAVQASRRAQSGTMAALTGAGILLAVIMLRVMRTLRLETLQEAVERREAYVGALFSQITDVIMVVDESGIIRFANDAVENTLGRPKESLRGAELADLLHPGDLDPVKKLIAEAIARPTASKGEIRLSNSESSWHPFEIVVTNQLGNEEIAGLLVTLRDISERKVFENRISHQAYHDVLTGLPNRVQFLEQLQEAETRQQRVNGSVTVLFVDLDNFNVVNDSLGHETGDHLLIAFADRLRECLRPQDLIARLGGDEFAVLLEDLKGQEHALRIADRILEGMIAPVSLKRHELFVSVSIGIVYSTEASENADDLLRAADTAMYEAKVNGKAGHVLFDRSMKDRVVERMEMEAGLHLAVEREEFRVHYQPLIDLETGKLTGVEALMRWEHPSYGLITPGKFIPLAEESGLIVPMGHWILKQSCRQLTEWRAAYPHCKNLIVNVNLSGKQLQRSDIVEQVATILEETQLPPQYLKLEITESVLMVDIEDTVAKLKQLKALGIKLAIDDFGTGYSSMASMSAYPVDTIKIDRSFISRISDQSEAASVVGTIILLAKALRMDVTAEGIENENQVTHLQWLGCNTGQGFYFAKPLTPGKMEERINNETTSLIKARDEAERELIERLLKAV